MKPAGKKLARDACPLCKRGFVIRRGQSEAQSLLDHQELAPCRVRAEQAYRKAHGWVRIGTAWRLARATKGLPIEQGPVGMRYARGASDERVIMGDWIPKWLYVLHRITSGYRHALPLALMMVGAGPETQLAFLASYELGGEEAGLAFLIARLSERL